MPPSLAAFLYQLLLFLLARYAQIFITIFLVLCTPSNSQLRLASIPLQLLLAAVQIPISCLDRMKNFIAPTYRSVCGSTAVLQTIWVIDVVVMLKWDTSSVARDVLATRRLKEARSKGGSRVYRKEDDENSSQFSMPTTVTTKDKVNWLFDLAGNTRCIDTPYCIRGIPAWDSSRPSWIPKRTEALYSKIASFLIAYLLRDMLLTLVLGRVPIGLFWAVYYRYYLDYTGLIAGALALGFSTKDSDVQSWPPHFGSFSDTSTVRGFWGKFWHQHLRFTLTSFSDSLCKDILGLRGLVQRYTNLCVVYLLSATMHLAQDIVFGIPLEESRAVFFFCAQAVGIMIEDAAQSLWRWVSGRAKTAPTPKWTKVIGWVWTWTFITYTGNVYMAPYEQSFGELYRLPFRPTEMLLHLLGFDSNLTRQKEL